MKLIENAHKAWQMFSVQAMALAGILQFLQLTVLNTWYSMPAEMRSSVAGGALQWVTIALMGMGILGRLIQQWPTNSEGKDAS